MGTEQLNYKEEYTNNVKNATFEELSSVLNDIAKESGDEKFLSSPRNPNPGQKLVVEGNAMFEGYGGVKSDWTELFERKAKQQLALGNKDGYDRFMKSSNDLKEYYEKNI